MRLRALLFVFASPFISMALFAEEDVKVLDGSTYLYKLTSDFGTETRKMMLLK